MEELKNARLRVVSSFSTKIPSPDVAYASMDKSVSYSLEFDVPEGYDLAQITEYAQEVEALMDLDVKAAVATHLGLEQAGPNALPVIEAGASKPATSAPRSGGWSGRSSAGRSSSGKARPKTVDLDGETFKVWDNRATKKGRQPDFRLVEGEYLGKDAFWVGDEDGDLIASLIDG